ncbi:MAG: S8 family serine peptidase, partial [Nanoarchaeota archaeon]
PTYSQEPTKLSLYFDKKLNIKTEELAKQMSNVAGYSVFGYNENEITVRYGGKNINPFMIAKSGDGNAQYTSFNGYIIELQDEPLIAKESELMEKAEKNEEKIASMSYLNPLKYAYMILSTRISDVPDELAKQKEKIISNREKVKESISEALNKQITNQITGNVVSDPNKINVLGEYEKVFNGFALDVNAKEAEKIGKVKGVSGVHTNNIVWGTLKESVPLINADKVWLLDEDGNNCTSSGKDCLTGKGVTIAIIDTGVDYTHPDLGGCFGQECKVIGGYDFVNQDNDPMDDNGHGTHVAATAAGNGALKGVAPDAKIVAYKVLNSEGSGSFNEIIAAIERSVDPNQDGDFSDHLNIISMSLGAGCFEYNKDCGPDDPLSTAVDNAVKEGVVAVIAAGNSGPSKGTIGTPGTARKAITVGATDKNNQMALFSSRGPVEFDGEYLIKPDIVAPGVNICAALSSQHASYFDTNKCLDNNHMSISGTSMATPHIAGAAALLKQADPSWAPEDIKSALMLYAKELGYDSNEHGAGLADVEKSRSAAILTSPAAISFEKVVDELPKPKKITIKNNKKENVALNLEADCGVAYLNKKNISIMPRSSEDVFLSIIDLPEKDGAIKGTLAISDGLNKYKVPYSLNSVSQLVISVKAGNQQPHYDVAITDESLSYIKTKYDAGKDEPFYLPSGKYIAYAVGDLSNLDTEYILMKVIDVPKNKKVPVTLDIKEAKPFRVKAQSLDGTNLVLYEWQKAFRVYNGMNCFLNYDMTDPNYGNRTVYVSNRPSNNLDTDIFFKYDGVPSKARPKSGSDGSSRGFSWRLCS